MDKKYNCIIVGAGSAGCVLANRLSEDPTCQVLLIESGPKDSSMMIRLPKGYAKLMADPSHAWMYPVNKVGSNELEFHIRGRTLGGSSAINGLVYARGLASDFDNWKVPGWGWSDFLSAFKSIEGHEYGGDETRGGKGPLKITSHGFGVPVCDAVIKGVQSLGVPMVDDFNSVEGERIGYTARNIARGRRVSAAEAFLKSVLSRPNLEVITDTEVSRVVIEDGRAVGLDVTGPQGAKTLRADREIILSAGAINSTKLLMLSGIGPGEQLRKCGIDVYVDSPSVGQNMSDHRYFSILFRAIKGGDNNQYSGWRLYVNVLRQFFLGTGPMSRPAFEVGAYLKTRPDLNEPDFRMLMGAFSVDRAAGKMAMEKEPGFNIGGYQMRPKSRGSLEIVSKDPKELPRIDTNAFAEEEDVKCAIGAIRLIRKISETPALAPFAPRETFPGIDMDSDQELADFLRKTSGSGQHISGTCRMGTDEASVVDENLRVRGVSGLRVADISIMPAVTSGNTNAPAMAIGHLAAQKIKSS